MFSGAKKIEIARYNAVAKPRIFYFVRENQPCRDHENTSNNDNCVKAIKI